MIELRRTTSNDKDFKTLIKELDSDLRARYNNVSYQYDANINVENLQTVVLALMGNISVGCGCIKGVGYYKAELKRMFVNPYFRGGYGVSTSIMKELLLWSKELDYKQIVLETGTKQPEAIRFFEKHGFIKISNFEPYTNSSISYCMAKDL